MKLTRPLGAIVTFSIVAAVTFGFAGAASADPPTANPTPASVTGTLANGTGVVAGTFDVTRFAVENGTLLAFGTFTGTVMDATGAVTSGTQPIALPVDIAQSNGSCENLDLVLGSRDLNLLGQMVHLDTAHLNITAQGPGSPLCAVARLLDGPTGTNAILTQIANLLNRLLGVVG